MPAEAGKHSIHSAFTTKCTTETQTEWKTVKRPERSLLWVEAAVSLAASKLARQIATILEGWRLCHEMCACYVYNRVIVFSFMKCQSCSEKHLRKMQLWHYVVWYARLALSGTNFHANLESMNYSLLKKYFYWLLVKCQQVKNIKNRVDNKQNHIQK